LPRATDESPEVSSLPSELSLNAALPRVAAIESRVERLQGPPAATPLPAPAPAPAAAPTTFAQALAFADGAGGGALVYPLAAHGDLIGMPYRGTHTLYGNWESDNAVDVKVPTGTPVLAVADGTIGSQIGPIDSSDPHLQGMRLHLETAGDEFYYAHLSQILVRPGDHVARGQVIGYSGSANGVEHLHFAEKTGNPVALVSGSTRA